ncbi:MAG: carboxylating nicotinate-nucleotide diphosphorylase [Candidatus Cloacimonetes bacterium]|nr:carboxylating nicotinate-nucleotide diphosphorylase [Candidatus Cloacimonadota bacterium]MDD4155294.1 carboxylating nicotinate-nucleotide diphosphorylase [Candidatus Cloacimonadota bacterium]
MKVKEIIELALQEDIGTGDITTDYLELPKKNKSAYLIAKQAGVLCGLQIAFDAFKIVDESVKCIAYRKDGDMLKIGETFAKVEGYSSSILKGERVALNFLQRLSGIATLTKSFVDNISPFPAKLLDTRKTTPLLRQLEKYAVKTGGAYNHRFGLYDMIMIKENHIHAAGSISQAVKSLKKQNATYRIEVEVTNLEELEEAVNAKVDRVMLDNMSIELMREAVQKYSGKVELEASGNVTLETIHKIASTGVDYISSGALTHSYKSLDISLLFKEV